MQQSLHFLTVQYFPEVVNPWWSSVVRIRTLDALARSNTNNSYSGQLLRLFNQSCPPRIFAISSILGAIVFTARQLHESKQNKNCNLSFGEQYILVRWNIIWMKAVALGKYYFLFVALILPCWDPATSSKLSKHTRRYGIDLKSRGNPRI